MKRFLFHCTKSTPRLALVFFLLVSAFILISSPSAFAVFEKSSKKECAICHVMWLDEFRSNQETLIKWQPGNVLMKNTQGVVSSEAMCYSCHDGYVVDSRYSAWKYHNHPTFVKPPKNMKIPKAFPLSNKNEIYCGTCHSPHSGETPMPGAIPAQFMPGPLFFLRVPNVDSEMCEQCHVDQADYKRTHSHPVHTVGMKIPEELFEKGSVRAEKKNTVICQTCHEVHGAKGSHLTVMDNSKSQLCMACHKERTIIGTLHDFDLTMPDETNIKGQSLAKSGPCSACHVPHNAAGSKLWARKRVKGNPASEICLSCHTGQPGSKIKGIGRYSHPINVAVVSKAGRRLTASELTNKLPLFPKNMGKNHSVATVQCFTCHNIHQWDPTSRADRGGKNAKANASNSFLRIPASPSSALCLECHRDKQQVLSHDHNLALTAPGAKNIQGADARASGPCGACHIPHNAEGPWLWARPLSADKDLLPQYCIGCHNKNGAAKEKPTGANDHPVNVVCKGRHVAPIDQVTKVLPLFGKNGKIKSGETIECLTCHNPHIWDPNSNDTADDHQLQKNTEGDGRNSFLRETNAPTSHLCGVCHPDKTLVEGTDHDLSVTAPEAKNLLGQTVNESGECSACHLAHYSPNKFKLWARTYGPIGKDEHPMDALCTSCHAKGRIAANKVPAIATHPMGKLVENLIEFKKEDLEYRADFGNEALKYTPLFDNQGKRVKVGNICCPSCHNAHQWSSSKREKGSYRKVEGNAQSDFLRTRSSNNVCVYCHGPDALYRYRFFHVPGKRRG